VILPPDGSVADYLASLDKLALRREPVFYPTHGAAITNPGNYIEQIRGHRLQRVQEVEAGLTAGCHTTEQLRQRIYPDIPASLYGGAELSIQASLDYLNQS
jgi:hydroxyacylglutathione hydrolase